MGRQSGENYKVFTLEPGMERQYDVTFVAKAGKEKTKFDRLLLPIIVFNDKAEKVLLPPN